MTQTPLQKLLKIRAFGRAIFQGQHFSIKFRRDATENLEDELARIRLRNPELLIYKTKKNKLIYGGTFSQHQLILIDELKLLR